MELAMCKVFGKLETAFASEIRLAMVVGEKREFGIMVMRNDDVYVVGPASSSTCPLLTFPGVGSSDEPRKIDQLCGIGITGISSGAAFVVVWTANGSAYAWGDNAYGQLGIGIRGGRVHAPEMCSLMDLVVICQVSCGESHAIALTQAGEIYAWGRNDLGQVGLDCSNFSVPVPTRVLAQTRVTSICCSWRASLALGANGELWSWGHGTVSDPNRRFQSPVFQCRPNPMRIPGRITQVIAGHSSVLALCENGKLYHWSVDQHPIAELGTKLGQVHEIAGSWVSDTLAFRAATTVYVCGWLPSAVPTAPASTWFASAAHAVLTLTGTTGRALLFESKGNYLANTIATFLDDPETGDVKFEVEGTVIMAHKVVLKIRSEYFRKMFGGKWIENVDNPVLRIEGTTSAIFRSFLDCLYQRAGAPTSCDDAIELLKLADYYIVPDLFAECENVLKRLACPENARKLYEVAVVYPAKELEKFLEEKFRESLIVQKKLNPRRKPKGAPRQKRKNYRWSRRKRRVSTA